MGDHGRTPTRRGAAVIAIAAALIAALLVGLAGCGATEPAPRRPSVTDPAVELAGELPGGADRCAVTRPGRIAPVRRALIRPLSQGGPAAWLSHVPVRAHGWATRTDGDGHRASVALLRVQGDRDEVRRRIESELDVRLSWEALRCEGPDCAAYRARFVGDDLVQLTDGRWPERAQGGVTERCVALARAYPQALEVSSRRGRALAPDLAELAPRRIDTTLREVRDGVRLVRRRRMASEAWAARARRLTRERAGPDELARLAADASTRRRGRFLVSAYRFHYEDLALAREDSRRLQTARAAAARRTYLVPSARVDVNDLREVRRQVTLRVAAMEREGRAGRAPHARALRRLLERATARHPRALDLSRRLVRLLLDDFDEPTEAEKIVEAVLSRVTEGRAEWRLLRREARAARSTPALARALERDGIADAAHAHRAARDLVRLRRHGVDYAWAEGALRVALALDPEPGGRRGALARPVRLPLASLVATAVALAGAAAEEDPSSGLYVWVRGEAVGGGLAREPACLPLHDVRGERVCVGGLRGGLDARALAMGRALGEQLGRGSLTVGLVRMRARPSSAGPERVLWMGGAAEDGELELERASGSRDAAGWARVRRYVAAPLAGLAPRVFPAPELPIQAESTRHADQLLRRAAEREDVRCRAAGRRVRCELPTPDSPGSAARVLLHLVGPLVPGL